MSVDMQPGRRAGQRRRYWSARLHAPYGRPRGVVSPSIITQCPAPRLLLQRVVTVLPPRGITGRAATTAALPLTSSQRCIYVQ